MDERDWTDRPLAEGARLSGPGCSVTRVGPGVLHAVSGDLEAALAALAPGAAMLGFGETPGTADFALRVGRDHALLVTGSAIDAPAGWDARGFALSAAGGAYARLDLVGPAARDLLASGLASAPPWGSPSASVQAFGARALVSGRPEGLTLWVERGALTACNGLLSRGISGLPSPT
jgi:hypothetical protein